MCRDAVCGYVVLAGGKSMNIRQDFEDKTVALILVMDRPNQEKRLLATEMKSSHDVKTESDK